MRLRPILRAGGGLCLGLLAAAAVAAQEIRLLIYRTPLAGSQYHAAGELWPQLQVGDRLELVREAGNRHDSRAIRVDWRGSKLGYLEATVELALEHPELGDRFKAYLRGLCRPESN